MNLNINNELTKIINSFNSAQYDLVINKTSILLKKNQNNDFLWNIRGLTLQIQKKYKLSIECFLKALQINSNNLAAINNLGISYKNSMNYGAAEKCFNKIISKNSSNIKALINLGNLKNETYNFDEAITLYKKAIDLDDKIPECHLSLAYVYQSIGEITKAKEHLNITLRIDKSLTQADKRLSVLIDYKNDTKHLPNMIDKTTSLELNDEKKINLYFAIAKAFEDLFEFDESFKYLDKANKLQRSKIQYNHKNIKKLSKNIKTFFSSYKSKVDTETKRKNELIFIVGMPRSGTTLVEKIISSHSKVSGLGELNIISNILHGNIIKDYNIDVDKIDNFLSTDLKKSYMFYLEHFKIKGQYIIDKSITNFWFVGFIKHFFPDSKIIHCSRDSKDTCLSIYKNHFDTKEGWFYSEENLGDYYNMYEDLMIFWNKKFEGQIYNIKYENLVKNSDEEIKKIINFCDLEWENDCLNFHKNKSAIKTLSVNQANKPIYNSSVNSFANYKEKLKILFSKLN